VLPLNGNASVRAKTSRYRLYCAALDINALTEFLDSLCTGYQQDRLQIRDAIAGTCDWIWRHPHCRSFREGVSSHILHITGKPGCVLAKYIFNRLGSPIGAPGAGDSKPLYHFCDKRKRPGETASIILQNMIHQLLSWTPSLS
jgi:hypothetical protein